LAVWLSSQLKPHTSRLLPSCPSSLSLASMPSRPSIAQRPASRFQFILWLTDKRPSVRLATGNFGHESPSAAATVMFHSLEANLSPPVLCDNRHLGKQSNMVDEWHLLPQGGLRILAASKIALSQVIQESRLASRMRQASESSHSSELVCSTHLVVSRIPKQC
jgi:hypothetical protein